MSAIEDLRAATAAAAETARVAAVAAEKAQADLQAAREEEEVANRRDEFEASFGSTSEWIGAGSDFNGDLSFSVFRYSDYEGSASINREEAIILRDFLNDWFKDY